MAAYSLEESSGGGFPRLHHPQRLNRKWCVCGGGGVPHIHPQRLNKSGCTYDEGCFPSESKCASRILLFLSFFRLKILWIFYVHCPLCELTGSFCFSKCSFIAGCLLLIKEWQFCFDSLSIFFISSFILLAQCSIEVIFPYGCLDITRKDHSSASSFCDKYLL